MKDVRTEAVVATKLFLNVGFGGSVYKTVRSHLVAEAMGRLIDERLIRGWGLSQVDVDIIDRAQRVTPLSAIQNIYSMVERDSEARTK